MDNEVLLLIKSWPILLTIIAGLIWFIRLEAKVLSNEKDTLRIDRELTQVEMSATSKIDILSNSLSEIRCSLARIEGALSKSIETNKNKHA